MTPAFAAPDRATPASFSANWKAYSLAIAFKSQRYAEPTNTCQLLGSCRSGRHTGYGVQSLPGTHADNLLLVLLRRSRTKTVHRARPATVGRCAILHNVCSHPRPN